MKASQRILPDPGVTELTNMAWMVSFLALDISRMPLNDMCELLDDVRAIAKLALSERSEEFPAWKLIPHGTIGSDRKWLPYQEWAVRSDLEDNQKALRRAIDELTTTGRIVLYLATSITRPSIAFEITRSGRTRYPALILLMPTSEDIWRSFDVRFLFVLQTCAAQLRVCANGTCSKIFLKTGRSDRQYCPGEKCGQAQRQRKYRVAKKLATAKLRKKQLGERTRRKHGTKTRKR